jgi:hypothetical protein
VVKTDILAPPNAALAQGNTLSFYQELAKALWQASAEYSGVVPSALNKRNVAVVLGSRGVDDGTIANLLTVLNECEWALYAPEHEISDAELALEKARAVVDRLT